MRFQVSWASASRSREIDQGWTYSRSPHSFLFWNFGGQDWEDSRRIAQRHGGISGVVVNNRNMYAHVGETNLFDGLVASQRYTNLIEGYFQGFFGIRFVWFSSVFLFSGGGVRIYLSMLFSLISDVVPSHLRYVLGGLLPKSLIYIGHDWCIFIPQFLPSLGSLPRSQGRGWWTLTYGALFN